MKISYNWLREFIGEKIFDPETLGEQLTLHTAEVEEIDVSKDRYEGVYTGKVVDFKPHPNSEKLSIAQFDLGKKGVLQGIFGKVHEVAVGEILPIAVAGAKLASGIEIKKTEMAGEATECMIADNPELGMKNDELIRFPADTPLGTPISEAIASADDHIIDIDNKTLTHRPDLMGHHGFAREIGTLLRRKWEAPEYSVDLLTTGTPVKVDLQAKTCSRVCYLRMENVTVGSSDYDTLFRLEHVGIRSISNIVDVTNVVLAELGQPMHAFDADKVEGGFVIRQAREGESLVALDGNEYQLTPADTVIADEKKVLSIAGIMGGLYSGVTKDTKNILLESATWDPTAVRLTSQRLGLRSDSSMRYEKSLDAAQNPRAILRAIELIQRCCPGAQVVSPLTDLFPQKSDPIVIDFRPEQASSFAGVDIQPDDMAQCLDHLGFSVDRKNEPWKVTVPSFRATKDVSIPEDLVEEVVRIHGLENVPFIDPAFPITPSEKNVTRQIEWRVKDFLVARAYHEIYGYTFTDEQEKDFSGSDDFVVVKNPLSSEHQYLRQTLSYNVIKHIEPELRAYKSLEFFQIGKVFREQGQVYPLEELKLMLLRGSMGGDENELFYTIRDDLTALLHSLGLSVRYEPWEKPEVRLHPSKAVRIVVDDDTIGYVGLLHPGLRPTAGAHIALVDLSMEDLVKKIEALEISYAPLNPYPVVRRDISLIVPQKVLVGDMIEKMVFHPLIKEGELFDEFIDAKKLGEGVKNLAFHVSFQHPDKTLEEQEVDQAIVSLVEQLEKTFGAKLRMDFDQEM